MSKTTKTRTKVTVIPPPTREEMMAAMQALNDLKTAEQTLSSDKNAAIQAAQAPFDLDLGENKAAQEEAFATIKHWAETNPEEFEKIRSIATPHGTLGFRLSPYAVVAKKGFTIKGIIAWLMKKKALRLRYIRVKLDLNREALLEDREHLKPRTMKTLEKHGLLFGQETNFFVTTTIENVDATVKEAA